MMQTKKFLPWPVDGAGQLFLRHCEAGVFSAADGPHAGNNLKGLLQASQRE